MPVITSAIVAVTAAVLAGGAVAAGVATVATVATIGMVVAGAGLAIGVVGMVTKNKDLVKVGTLLGAAGGGAALGAAAAGAMGLGAAGSAATSGVEAGTQVASEAAKSGADMSVQGMAQVGDHAASQVASETAMNATTPLIDSSVGSSVTGGLKSAAPMAQDLVGQGTVLAPTGTDTIAQGVNQSIAQAGIAAPGAPISPWAGTAAPTATMAGVNAPPPPAPTAPSAMGDYTKGMLALGGMQMAGSAAGGLFQGQQASKNAELQKIQQQQQQQQIDLQRQQAEKDEAQRQLINSNNRYATRIVYGPQTGMIRRAY